MNKINKISVSTGIYWIEIADADFRMLCGAPADAVKHLMIRGLIVPHMVDDTPCETGPNAILLSDVPVQNGNFCNLAEFPVLQMLYRQGMFLPGHPNNTGRKPLLIGHKDQVDAQLQYIYRGNYGLVSKEEIEQAGVSSECADLMMRIKLQFAFGNIRESKDFIEPVNVGVEPVRVQGDVRISRTGSNQFLISYDGESVEVDLNLLADESYSSPYPLNYHNIERGYFDIIHSGDGDGWDVRRPSMASILVFQGSVYLIDAGPNVDATLKALGIGINEIEGIFHTHSHDDHFAGITTLIRAGRKIKYFATPLVRSAVAKKVSALLSIDEDSFGDFFDVHDLSFNEWNNIDGLEVCPLYSPHPVENNILLFRTLGQDGDVSYAHFADISAFSVLQGMINKDGDTNGLSQEELDQIKTNYLIPASIKKIDAGGGMIHGEPEDFRADQSDMIILSHRAGGFSTTEREIGSGAPFGTTHSLISSFQNFHFRSAFLALCRYFTGIGTNRLRPLANNKLVTFNPEEIIIRDGDAVETLFLIVTGTVEVLDSQSGKSITLSAGAMAGDNAVVQNALSQKTYRSTSFVRALQISKEQFLAFIHSNELMAGLSESLKMQAFLEGFSLLNESVPQVVFSELSRLTGNMKFDRGAELKNLPHDQVYLVSSGLLELRFDGVFIENIKPGGYFGEESVVRWQTKEIAITALEDTEIYGLPASILCDVPIIRWKLLESMEYRRSLVPDEITSVAAACP